MNGEPLLEVKNLDVTYRVGGVDLRALREVSFSIGRNEVLGLVGESGCGKSTVAAALLRILAGNGRITGGSITFAGRDLATFDREGLRRIRGGEIAMIFQDPLGSLNPTITVGRQLMQVAASHPEKLASSGASRRRRAIELLSEVGIPDAARRFDDYPHQFSGGMRQRIMIAMALMLEPALVVADEATSALDVTLQAQILELFRAIKESHGTSILLVSHDLGVVAETCDRVVVMYAGRVVEEARTRTLFSAPRHPYTRALLAAVPSYRTRDQRLSGIPGRVPALDALPPGCTYAERCEHRHPRCVMGEPALYPLIGGSVRCFLFDPDEAAVSVETVATPVPLHRSHTGHTAHPGTGAAQPLLSIRGLSTHFDERQSIVDRLARREPRPVQAVAGVDLDLFRGEILGLVGESGSGKTTLALSVLRLVAATSGDMRFDGVDLRALPRRELRQLRRRMQIILQDPTASLSPRLRVADLLAEPYRINGTPSVDRYSVPELLDLVGLTAELADKYPYQLSGGQARRVGIARALALKPDLVVADEPTSGLDVSAAAGVLTLMDDLRHELALTYLLITHDLNVVGHVADRIAVMYLGRVVETGTSAQILTDPVHPYTQGLLAAIPQVGTASGDRETEAVPPGEVPSPRTPPSGCRFHTRCRLATDLCVAVSPDAAPVESEHEVACHLWQLARESRPGGRDDHDYAGRTR